MWNNSTTKYWCTSLVFGTKYVQLPILKSILVGSVLLIFFWVLLCVFTFWVPCFCDVRYHFRIKTMFGSSLLPVVCRRAHAWITFFVSFLRIVVFNTYCVMLCQIFLFSNLVRCTVVSDMFYCPLIFCFYQMNLLFFNPSLLYILITSNNSSQPWIFHKRNILNGN
jgi:hypothetical protein